MEDLYRPYKQKRRTRATIAREKGLAPLAELLFAQGPDCPDPTAEAARYVDAEKGVETVEDALSGASDIIAEAEQLVGNRVPLADAARLVHPHPTFSETLGEALLKADGRPLHTR